MSPGLPCVSETFTDAGTRMNLVERYIFKIAVTTFLVCLIGLTAVIWITQALRELDLLTGKGQTFLIFLMATGLSLPGLVAIIAPVALFIAVVYTLNKLNGDSELIVMSAAGVPPAKLARPFVVLAAAVSLVVGVMAVWLIPSSFNELRNLITKVRADFVTNLVREGQFTRIDAGVTFSVRERSGDALLGIFIEDARDPARSLVYIAERGRVAEVEGSSYLVLEKGSMHTRSAREGDSAIVAFERYAVDLAAFAPAGELTFYKPRERSTLELFSPDPDDPYYRVIPGRFRSELHDRLTAWLYPLAMAAIAFAALGDAQTTRQGRGFAIGAAVVGVVAFRIAGFAASSALARDAAAIVVVWGLPLLAIGLSALYVLRGAALRRSLARLTARLRAGGRAPAPAGAR